MDKKFDGLKTLTQMQQKQQQGEELEIHQPPWPENLAEEAFHGLAGDIVRAIEPHTEADPAALLTQFLVAFGNAVGYGPHVLAEADRHGTNIFAVLVGTTSKARKGTSWGYIRRLFEAVDQDWARGHVAAGLSSGEGLIWAVRDPIMKREAIKQDGHIIGYEEVEEDPGVIDKRLLVYEAEFASTLQVLGRTGNTLSANLREAWDNGNLRSLVKNSPAKATEAHISILGHVTKQELLRYLDNTEAGNGFANRFLWVCVRRSKVLPEGGNISGVNFQPLLKRLAETIEYGKTAGELRRDEDARAVWLAVYPKLSDGQPGLLGAVTARAEAQVMRLALIYALLDMAPIIRREHLEAALAVWEYVEQSAQFIFGDALGDPIADQILEALRQTPEGLTRTAIRDLFQRNQSGKRIATALAGLLAANLIKQLKEPNPEGGRPAERWIAL